MSEVYGTRIFCPFCDSQWSDVAEFQSMGGDIFRRMYGWAARCGNCRKSWYLAGKPRRKPKLPAPPILGDYEI
jgi:hypothetical protein